MKKRLLSIAIVLCLIFTLLPMSALAVTNEPYITTSTSTYTVGQPITIYGVDTNAYVNPVTFLFLNGTGDSNGQVAFDNNICTFTPMLAGQYTLTASWYTDDNDTSSSTGYISGTTAAITIYVSGSSYTAPTITVDLPSSKTVDVNTYTTFQIYLNNPSNTSVNWYLYQTSGSSVVVNSGTVYSSGYISTNDYIISSDNRSSYQFTLEYYDENSVYHNLYSTSCYITVGSTSKAATPTVSISPASTAAAVGATINLVASASVTDGGSLTYQWYVGRSSTFSGVTAITGATSYFYSGTAPTTAGTYYYFCQVTNTKSGVTATNYASAVVTVAASSTGNINNFKNTYTYSYGMFNDVNENQWYGANSQGVIRQAYMLGLMKGTGNNIFSPNGTISIAEVIAVAARIHCIYRNGADTLTNGTGNWYDNYVSYAVSNSIINAYDFSSYTASCSRAQMAYILSRSLPASELTAIRTVTTLPDVNTSTSYYTNIFTLYNAGVLSGGDTKGTYNPYSSIDRASASAIISRVAVPALRSSARIG